MTSTQSGGGVGEEPFESFGYALAMRVLQSTMYQSLDDKERAECDELIRRGQSRLRAARQDAGAQEPYTNSDGFGSMWICNEGLPEGECQMQIVRPGKMQCDRCDYPAPDGLSRERIEGMREDLLSVMASLAVAAPLVGKTPAEAEIVRVEGPKDINALCDMALRSLSQPAERVSVNVPMEPIISAPLDWDNYMEWVRYGQTLRAALSAAPGAGEGGAK